MANGKKIHQCAPLTMSHQNSMFCRQSSMYGCFPCFCTAHDCVCVFNSVLHIFISHFHCLSSLLQMQYSCAVRSIVFSCSS